MWRSLIDTYTKRIEQDVGGVGLLEKLVMYASQLTPTISSSDEVFYTFSTLSRLLRLGNDALLSRATTSMSSYPGTRPDPLQLRLITLLAILEDVDVLLEVLARRVGEEKLQRRMVVLIEIIRAASRGVLLLKHGNHTFSPSAALQINREALTCEDCAQGQLLVDGLCRVCDKEFFQQYTQRKAAGTLDDLACPGCHEYVDVSELCSWFEERGPRSGVTMTATRQEESIIGGHNCRMCRLRQSRAFKAASAYKLMRERQTKGLVSSALTLPLLCAEGLDIIRPSVHLALQGLLGRKSWTAYGVSLLVDIIVTYLRAAQFKHLRPHERRWHKRRALLLIKYLIRTPVLEDITSPRVESVMVFVRRFVPLGNIAASSVTSQLSSMQSLHTLQWSDKLV
ncbi:hypothetical protein PTSG_10570 [Salpingoeca rosetta]|uniref:Peroxisomal membrane protein PEX16 n=1 Tax=Salpingoeca rosetta (strain ATCC 50818 / BSB-021) TaxID=946362 RepID=F2URR0_SALR5|nr:uncharacterized protein PTSG_10570 [Salpingoeca rosetta]EGD80315.1 hypothetical protein PTSG_10570 [Salpingoeca rosetta]|eukprot:XP_004988105.1 hypothetical protein PTSG_10570 [Salpingoeca rosetta]